MEDFKKRLIKEQLELFLKTNKNANFIWGSDNFNKLDEKLQRLQLKQYFAQEEYLDVLTKRINILLTEQEDDAVHEALLEIFGNKYKDKRVEYTLKGETSSQPVEEVSASNMVTFKMSMITNNLYLYALIMDGTYTNYLTKEKIEII